MPKISRERVQDWIDDALNPMIEGIRREAAAATIRPFWSYSGRFEYFRPLAEYARDDDNLEDLEAHRPEVRQAREEHDRCLDQLRARLVEAQDAAEADDALVAEVARVRGPEADPSEAKYYLEYVAEGAGELGGDYTTAPVWNKHHRELRELFDRNHPDERRAVAEVFEQFGAAVRAVLGRLKQSRVELADEYEVRLKPARPEPRERW